MTEINVTYDQVIADLCTIRGKHPEIGTMKICNVSIENGIFLLSATDGKKELTMTITPDNEESESEEVVPNLLKQNSGCKSLE